MTSGEQLKKLTQKIDNLEEIEGALQQIKNNNAPEKDNIIIDMFKEVSQQLGTAIGNCNNRPDLKKMRLN